MEGAVVEGEVVVVYGVVAKVVFHVRVVGWLEVVGGREVEVESLVDGGVVVVLAVMTLDSIDHVNR